jgi:hypothetical protein
MRPFRALNDFGKSRLSLLERMAGTTRLELATSAVTAPRKSYKTYQIVGWVVGWKL